MNIDKNLTVHEYVESLQSEIRRLNAKITKLESVISLGAKLLSDDKEPNQWDNFKHFIFRWDRD